jgi:hypothetical protein
MFLWNFQQALFIDYTIYNMMHITMHAITIWYYFLNPQKGMLIFIKNITINFLENLISNLLQINDYHKH